jgi:hypothetical protein
MLAFILSGERLPTYRLYRLDGAGRISAAEWVDADDDGDARSKAARECSRGRYELWQHDRLVECIGSSRRRGGQA